MNNTTIQRVLELQSKTKTQQLIIDLSFLFVKAHKRIELIKNSKAITYELAGGYFERQKDLLKAEKAFEWIDRNLYRLRTEYYNI